MARTITLFTGQWADLPLSELAPLAKQMGYDGLELACWGDHFDVQAALASEAYCKDKRRLLESAGPDLLRHRHPPGRPRRCATSSTSATRASCPRTCGATAIPRGCAGAPPRKCRTPPRAAARMGARVVTGFTGSSVWHSMYAFPPTSQEYWERGFKDFAERWLPILDVFDQAGGRLRAGGASPPRSPSTSPAPSAPWRP